MGSAVRTCACVGAEGGAALLCLKTNHPPHLPTYPPTRACAAQARARVGAGMIARFSSPFANQRVVLAGVALGLAASAVPFAFKDVRRVEQRVQQRQYVEIDDKEAMRASRLST